jgi:hypothetical protein
MSPGSWIFVVVLAMVGLGSLLALNRRAFDIAKGLDRRWIFLMMLLAVAIPILGQLTFPETATGLAKAVFEEIEKLEEGDSVILSFDFDPASEGELGPMATAFTRHCCEKKLKMIYMALWPVGPQMIEQAINTVIRSDFPDYEYGVDYVNLGYKSGNEGVIKVVVTDLRELYTTDHSGTGIESIPMMKGIHSVQDSKLLITVSAGYAGTKEWVQYGSTVYPDSIRIVSGVTGVQAPDMYPYIGKQLRGLLGAIKGAAEYEKLVIDKYGGEHPDPKYLKAKYRMGPQLIAHVLIILLIILANIIYFVDKHREQEAAR